MYRRWVYRAIKAGIDRCPSRDRSALSSGHSVTAHSANGRLNSPPLSLSSHLAIGLSALAPAQRAGAQRFSALARLRHADCIEQCPSSRAKQKTYAQTEFFSSQFDPFRTCGEAGLDKTRSIGAWLFRHLFGTAINGVLRHDLRLEGEQLRVHRIDNDSYPMAVRRTECLYPRKVFK